MYHRLISVYQKQCLLSKEENIIYKIVGKRLAEREVYSIIQTYQKRLIEPDFNKEYFFLDLRGYLKYLKIEENNRKYCAGSITKNYFSPLKSYHRERLLEDYGYMPAVEQQERGCYKVSYLSRSKIIRFYYLYPASFLYSKLIGTSETDIIQTIGNNLLTVTSANIPGEPMDVLEQALPLSKVFDYLAKNSLAEIIAEIEKLKQSNQLITDFIEDTNDNIGLVIRLDQQGNKRVYVVAFDLDLRRARFFTRFSDRQLLKLIKHQQFAEPKFLSYERLVRYIPALVQLQPSHIYVAK